MKTHRCRKVKVEMVEILLTILVTEALFPPQYQFSLERTPWRNLVALGCGGDWDDRRKAYCFNAEKAAVHFAWLVAASTPRLVP